MNDDLGLILILTFAMVIALLGGLALGRMYERIVWKKLLPAQMERLCQECSQNKPVTGVCNGN